MDPFCLARPPMVQQSCLYLADVHLILATESRKSEAGEDGGRASQDNRDKRSEVAFAPLEIMLRPETIKLKVVLWTPSAAELLTYPESSSDV